jgi:hypothetical protein
MGRRIAVATFLKAAIATLLIGSPKAAAIINRQVSQLSPLKNGPKSFGCSSPQRRRLASCGTPGSDDFSGNVVERWRLFRYCL